MSKYNQVLLSTLKKGDKFFLWESDDNSMHTVLRHGRSKTKHFLFDGVLSNSDAVCHCLDSNLKPALIIYIRHITYVYITKKPL